MAVFKALLIALLGLTNTLVPVAAQNDIFHGTSVVITPNATSIYPGDSTYVAANFYCYFTPVGYFSFGWWLDATPGSDHSHCKPRPAPSSVGWYEFTTRFNCGPDGCRTHAINYLVAHPKNPFFEEDYVLAALELGNGKMGELGLSYFDKPGGGYAVGTRRMLNGKDAMAQTNSDCQDAFHTFEDLQENWNVSLPFKLENPCPRPAISWAQKILEL